MFYTYILRSLSHPEQRYTGVTEDLQARLEKHNAGEVPRTSKFKPWRIQTAIVFDSNNFDIQTVRPQGLSSVDFSRRNGAGIICRGGESGSGGTVPVVGAGGNS